MCPEKLDQVNKRNTNVNIYDGYLRAELKKQHFKKAPDKFYYELFNTWQASDAHIRSRFCSQKNDISPVPMTFPFDDVDFRMDLDSFRLELTDEEATIFDLYFIEEYNQEEVAGMLGFTQGRISQKIKIIEEKYIRFTAEEEEA